MQQKQRQQQRATLFSREHQQSRLGADKRRAGEGGGRGRGAVAAGFIPPVYKNRKEILFQLLTTLLRVYLPAFIFVCRYN